MTRVGIVLGALMLSSISAPSAGYAQSGPASAVESLVVGEVVRLQAPGMSIDLGTVTETDAETLYVEQAGQEWFVDIESIERLEVRRKSISKYVLIVGGLGALLGYSADAFRDESSVAPFVIAGVGAGAAIGLARWEWKVAFPR